MIRSLSIVALAIGIVSTSTAQEPVTQPSTVVLPEVASTAVPFRPTILKSPINNIARLHNSMSQALIGTGIVVGLNGSGSTDRATRSALVNLIRRSGLNVDIASVTSGGVALVQVTATLPPFAKVGHPLDVKCGSIGDATSLRGGQLIRTEMRAIDNDVYAVAEGPVVVGGYSAKGTNASQTLNHVTTGWVNNGGQVVKDLESSFFSESGDLEMRLLNPSAFNAASVASGIKQALQGWDVAVSVVDTSLVRMRLPREQQTNENAVEVLKLVGSVQVQVENPTKVIIDQANGTILAGEGVMISPCVVALSDLTVSILNDPDVVQPFPGINRGRTEVVERTRIEVTRDDAPIQPLSAGATIGDLLQNLRALGLTPPHLVSVFQALDHGGFLHAQLELR